MAVLLESNIIVVLLNWFDLQLMRVLLCNLVLNKVLEIEAWLLLAVDWVGNSCCRLVKFTRLKCCVVLSVILLVAVGLCGVELRRAIFLFGSSVVMVARKSIIGS